MARLANRICIATWTCPMHGAKDVWCCERSLPRYSLPRSETLGDIPWSRRSQVRHELQALHSRCLELRDYMPKEQGSRKGVQRELDQMIGTLQLCKKLLS
jgi:hypothetical protein